VGRWLPKRTAAVRSQRADPFSVHIAMTAFPLKAAPRAMAAADMMEPVGGRYVHSRSSDARESRACFRPSAKVGKRRMAHHRGKS